MTIGGGTPWGRVERLVHGRPPRPGTARDGVGLWRGTVSPTRRVDSVQSGATDPTHLRVLTPTPESPTLNPKGRTPRRRPELSPTSGTESPPLVPPLSGRSDRTPTRRDTKVTTHAPSRGPVSLLLLGPRRGTLKVETEVDIDGVMEADTCRTVTATDGGPPPTRESSPHRRHPTPLLLDPPYLFLSVDDKDLRDSLSSSRTPFPGTPPRALPHPDLRPPYYLP